MPGKVVPVPHRPHHPGLEAANGDIHAPIGRRLDGYHPHPQARPMNEVAHHGLQLCPLGDGRCEFGEQLVDAGIDVVANRATGSEASCGRRGCSVRRGRLRRHAYGRVRWYSGYWGEGTDPYCVAYDLSDG